MAPNVTNWPRAAASIAVFRDDMVLLAQRAKPPLAGVWSLPGGKVEAGETVAEAALRELGEETGIVADLLGQVAVHDVIVRDANGQLQAHYVIAVHAGLWRTGEPVGASDVSDAAFFPIAALDDIPTTDRARALIHDAYARYIDQPASKRRTSDRIAARDMKPSTED